MQNLICRARLLRVLLPAFVGQMQKPHLRCKNHLSREASAHFDRQPTKPLLGRCIDERRDGDEDADDEDNDDHDNAAATDNVDDHDDRDADGGGRGDVSDDDTSLLIAPWEARAPGLEVNSPTL